MAAAEAVDAKVAAGEELRPLEGLPLLVKASIDVAGTLTSCATPAMANFRPGVSAVCVERLVHAGGAIVIGKTNMPEMGCAPDGLNNLHGPALNPHNLVFNAGGSSTGTAVGIASGVAPAGIGSDTGGSCRIPAACCGIVGMRPSRGRWPTEGSMPCSRLRDTPGPMGASARDIALLDALVTGEAVVECPPDFLRGRKVVVAEDWMQTVAPWAGGVGKAQARGLGQAVRALKEAGASVGESTGGFLAAITTGKEGWVAPICQWFGPEDSAAELQAYLERHPRRPQPEMASVSSVIERATHPGPGVVYGGGGGGAGVEREERLAKEATRDEHIAKLDEAYRSYFREGGVSAVIVPTMPNAPTRLDLPPPHRWQRYFGNEFWSTTVCTNLSTPMIVLPTLAKGEGGTPTSVHLFGVDDRELLGVAQALERALKELPPDEEPAHTPCPGGCGLACTWHPSHCCQACMDSGGKQHGLRCERVSMSM